MQCESISEGGDFQCVFWEVIQHSVKKESERAGLRLNIQKTKIMASGAITSWQIDGETMETVADFVFLVSKILQMVAAAMNLKDTYSLEEKFLPT